MTRLKKVFIGGMVIGLLTGALVGGFTVAIIGATAFINYELQKDTGILGQTTITNQRTNN